ncbi:MAG: S41 family peptidase [Bacteroidales bacterium]|nr:S41 family peptidase [Bacteroidales bacterium]
MKKIVIILTLSLCTFVHAQDKGFEISKNLEIFSNVYKNVHLNYVDDVDPGKLMKTAIDAMLASLDPYTNYYAESDMEDVKLQLLGEYGGVGALIHQKNGLIYVAEPYEGLPADKAGLKAGDRILEVNGVSTEGKTTSDVSSAMRGQSGTAVKLKLSRDGRTFDCTLTRQEIKLPNVPYSGILTSGIGYIKLSEFTQDAAKNVRDAFRQLKKQNPDLPGVILDLRGNGGGLMNEAVEIVGMFVKRGELVVETKGKLASKNVKSYTRSAPEDLDIPVAVLIDGYSASASEIVSGSLQDFDRAVIIGSRSYGKGLVQNILPMTYNTQMKVTVSKYYIPSGRCIQALDYSHRDENGRATRVPDSLKTAFKTRNGRTVYDGFGIEPDVEVEQEYMSALALVLYQKFLVFDYATQFVKQHASIPSPSKFEITDEIYDDFRNFLSDKDYSYSTSTEKYLDDLKTIAKEEKYFDAVKADIEALEAKLKADKAGDLAKYRDEVSEMLKNEILARYYYQKGRVEGSLTHDKDVLKAVEILSDKSQYKKILSGK